MLLDILLPQKMIHLLRNMTWRPWSRVCCIQQWLHHILVWKERPQSLLSIFRLFLVSWLSALEWNTQLYRQRRSLAEPVVLT